MTKLANVKEGADDFSPASPDFDNDTYSDVARYARLRAVNMIAASFKLSPEYMALLMASENAVQKLNGVCRDVFYQPENGTVGGVFSWTAESKFGGKSKMKASSDYFISYGSLKNKDEKYVRLYFQKLAKFTSYPYFRGLVGMLAASGGIVIPPLPTITDRVD